MVDGAPTGSVRADGLHRAALIEASTNRVAMPPAPHVALGLVFFLSGASALIFETAWFREAGLVLGNSVWASSIVTASFMAGLAIGSALAARLGDRSRYPVGTYALLEGTVAGSGLALVYVLHFLPAAMMPLVRLIGESPAGLNAVRLGAAFSLLLVPSTAMGATLPVLVRALCATQPDYGRAVGLLYGWNTLGAVAGSLLGESVLVPFLGVRGSAATASLCDGLLALVALALARRWNVEPPARSEGGRAAIGKRALLILASAFLAGGLLLAMEVVWFRFLQLFVFGTSLAFAVMLAVVLLGIGLGSLAAGQWLRIQPTCHKWLSALAAAGGISIVLTYAAFADVTRTHPGLLLVGLRGLARASARLMLPTALISGALFTLMAKRLREEMSGDARAAAMLTAANTVGAAAGALLGGFVLLPSLGVEGSFFAAACGYGVLAIVIFLARDATDVGWSRSRSALATAFALCIVVGAFPFGLMRNHYLPQAVGRWRDGSQIVAVREEPSETLIYKRQLLWGETVFDRLIVNAFSMSSSQYAARRYMNLFVYLPVALHPAPRRALLICYGIGSTAKALTDTRELTSIDVVDTSRDILNMGRIVFPPPGYPLDDSRVRVHVEDGRFFLLTTGRRYDLITGEPPPPKNAGVVNLYSREYFQLIHDHLAEGGMASYWLPAYQLELPETKAVIRAFCDAFDDCSLWSGFSYEWVLLGTRHAKGPVSEGRFTRQWHDPLVAPTLRDLGFEVPEQLGAAFLADASWLRRMTRGVAALDDDHPLRISARFPRVVDPFYTLLMDPAEARQRFASSRFIAAFWPEEMRAASLGAFAPQAGIDRGPGDAASGPESGISELAAMLTRTRLRTPVYWLLHSSAREQDIARHAAARGVQDPHLDELLGVDAMASRDYVTAESYFSRASPSTAESERVYEVRVLALCLASRFTDAGSLAKQAWSAAPPSDLASWRWLAQSCGTPQPPGSRLP
jgi:spermidine synthase